MEVSGVWGTDVEMMALAHLLGKCVYYHPPSVANLSTISSQSTTQVQSAWVQMAHAQSL